MTSTIDNNEHMTSEEVNWLDLPDHLTLHIMGKLASLSDYVRFCAVCVSWRSLFLYDDSPKLPPSLPLLMVLTPTTGTVDEDKEKDKDKKKKKKKKTTKTKLCSLYSISDKRIYDQLQIRMPLNGHCRGFSNGWLVIVDDQLFFSLTLLNPFSGKQKSLPPLTAFPCSTHDMVCKYTYLRKAVLSANPTTNPKDYRVMAIYGHKDRLTYWKPGDKAWNPLAYRIAHIEDVIYYKGRFTAINCLGEILIWDETQCKIRKKNIAYPPSTDLSAKKYIVELLGSLLLVHRYIDYDDNEVYFTSGFKVYKLSSDPYRKGKSRWVEVKNLHDHMLFIRQNASMSISASGFTGCKPNSIYYTDDYEYVSVHSYQPGYGPHDLGVFDLVNESFEIHYPTDVKTPIWTAPIWVEITPQKSSKRCSNKLRYQ